MGKEFQKPLQHLNYRFRLHCSNLCNQSCDYCHVFRGGRRITKKPGLMDISVARQAIDAYARLIQEQEDPNIMIRFYGGEPLLNWRMIKQALSYGRQLFNGKTEVQWILNTNGTLITSEIANVLKHEEVDVHISIDGADEVSNQHRKFKNGKPVLKQVLKSLEILKKEDCRVQIDSCLTDANLYSLHGLIDLAVDAGADRIFLALTDCPQDQYPLDIELITRKILEATNYAEQNGIFLGTPWMMVMSGSSNNMAGQSNQVLNLVIEPTGQVSFLTYHEKKLGQVDRLEEILASPLLLETIKEWEKEKQACRGCELENSCRGYLKSMVMYHTGGLDGYERECQLAMSVLKGLKASANRELVLSRQLIGQYHQERTWIINRLAGTSINSTPEVLNYLDLFKNPTNPAFLYEKYSRPDIWPTTSYFMNINFLIPEDIDEEAQWLEGMVGSEESKIFETEHSFTYYHEGEGYLARDFTDLMEETYRVLITKGLPHLKKKILILVCQSRTQFKQFWGSPPLPEWVNAFVHLGRILVVDRQKILPKDRKSAGFLRGMAHELVHIFLNEEYAYLPTWMEEGLCEYYSRPYDDSKFKKIARERRLYGFREMEAFVKHSLLDLDDSPVKENVCYQQAHSFVHFMARLAGEKELIECIRATGLSKSFREVFEEHYGRSLDDMEAEWREKYSSVNYRKIKPSRNLRIIQNNNKVLLYNAFYGRSLMTNNDMLDLLDYVNKGKTIREIREEYEISGLDHVITSMHNKGLIVFDDQAEENRVYRVNDDIETGRLITKLRLHLTNACNMSCTYCYIRDIDINADHMSWPIAKNALDSYFEIQKRNGNKNSQIRFFGGEPMLTWPLIERIFKYVPTIKEGIEVDYIVNTNGTILTAHMAQVMAENKVIVVLSLDGVGTVHDLVRRFRLGQGSFAIIDKNLDIFLANRCSVGIETTLGDHNYGQLKELIDYLVDKGGRHNCQIPLGLQNITITPKDGLDSRSIDAKVAEIVDVIRYARQRGVDAMTGMVTVPFNTLLGKRSPGVYCRAMGEEVCIYPNGEIGPCSNIQTKLGTVEDMEGVFKSDAYIKMSQRVAGNITECMGCDIEAFCAGGCAADAMALNGDIFTPTGNCELEKLIFRKLVKEFLLGKEEKDTAKFPSETFRWRD